jgi:hypothetical protein
VATQAEQRLVACQQVFGLACPGDFEELLVVCVTAVRQRSRHRVGDVSRFSGERDPGAVCGEEACLCCFALSELAVGEHAPQLLQRIFTAEQTAMCGLDPVAQPAERRVAEHP